MSRKKHKKELKICETIIQAINNLVIIYCQVTGLI